MEENISEEHDNAIPKAVDRFDDFGFAVFKDGERNSDERHHNFKQIELTAHQVTSWQEMMSNWSHTQLHTPERLRSYLKKGVPPNVRPQLWRNILGCKQLNQASTFNYKEHVSFLRLQLVDLHISEYTLADAHYEMWSENAKTPDEVEQGRKILPLHTLRQIIVDIDRTFPTHRLFMTGSHEAIEGKAALFRVLGIYALYNPEVGYCQGMSYLAGMLLMQMKNEEEVFWSMVALFEKPKYLMGYFDNSLTKIQEHALVFQKLLHNRMRRLDKHLISFELNPLVFVTPWFMCLYTSLPCWDAVLAIWDLILLDGISTIFRVALAVLHLCQRELLDCEELSHLLPKLLHPPLSCMYYDTLMPMVWKMSVEKWEIKSLQNIVTEEKLKRLGLKRCRSNNKIVMTTQSSHPAMKKPRRDSEKNNNSNDVDSATSSGSIFQRVFNIFNPQRALQDTTNNYSEQTHDLSVTKKSEPDQNPNCLPQKNQNRPGLRPRGPGGARLLNQVSNTSFPHTNLTDSPESVWAMVGSRFQGVDVSTNGGIGHPFGGQRDPVVKFSINRKKRPKSTQDDDRVSPCTLAVEDRNDISRHVRFNFTEPIIPSPLVTMETQSPYRGQSSIRHQARKSPRSRWPKPDNLKSPHVAGIYFRRKLAGRGNPLNVPTNRRLIGESARLQHSFKTFHTPTPLRRSQRIRLSSSPACLSSPEVELTYFGGTPMQISTPDA